MDEHFVKTSKNVKLKPNGLFADIHKPYFYQRRGGLLLLMRPRMVLGDDVGLGKTLEMLLAGSYLKAQKTHTKFLVFTESTALNQWKQEAQNLVPSLRTKIITRELYPDPALRIKTMRNPEADMVLTTYSMLYRYWHHLKAGMQPRWVAVFDEPDIFKNTEAEAHRLGYELVNGEGGASRIYALTATVVGNRLDEAFGILRVVAPGALESRKQFEEEFCIMRRIKRRRIVKGYKNLDKFRAKIESVYYGRTQDDPEVMQDLPKDLTKDVELTMSEAQSSKVVEAMDKLITLASGETKQLGILPALTMAQQLTNDPRLKDFPMPGIKTESLLETINGSLKGQRIVVFSKFRSVVDLLEAETRKITNFPVLRITGKEKWSEKEAAKDFFMSDSPEAASSILFLTNAGRRAINLQKGGHLFFYDMPWSYDSYRQIIGRLKRTGSLFKVIGVYRMLGRLHPKVAALVGSDKTVDDHTLKILMKKYELYKAVTGESQAKTIEAGDGELLEIYDEIKASYRHAA